MTYLVLLHGWGTTGNLWGRELVPWRGPGFRVPDSEVKPGDVPSEEEGPIILAPDITRWEPPWLADYLAGLPWEDTVVLGWSLGGMLLLETLADTGRQPAAVVLVATPASFCRRPDYPFGHPPAVVRAMRQRITREAEAVLREFALNCLAPGEEQFARVILSHFTFREGCEPNLKEGLDYLLAKDLRPKLPQAPAGISIIQGGVDQIVDVSQAFFLHQHLPDSRLYLVPGAGHAPFLTQTEEFHRILREILF